MALGLAQIITDGVNVREVPPKLVTSIGVGRLFGQIPWLVVIAAASSSSFGVVLAATRFGRHTYAIGSNDEAARRAGINVDRHLIKVYGLAGALAGLAGYMSLARFATTTIGGHSTDNLQAIAAVVLGGTSLFGGIGTDRWAPSSACSSRPCCGTASSSPACSRSGSRSPSAPC